MEPNQPEQTPVEPTEQPTIEPTESIEPIVEEDTEPTTEPVAAPMSSTEPAAASAPVVPLSNSTAPVVVVNPGKTMGIVSFVLSLVGIGLVGLILGIIAKKKSKTAGQGNGFALAGIIIGIVNIVVVALIVTFAIIAAASLAQKCNQPGSGVTCSSSTSTTQPY